MRINVAAATSFWLIKDLIAARLMTIGEMYDCYMRNTLIFLPHMNGHGLNKEKGITRFPTSATHTQAEEATMAKKRRIFNMDTGKGGFKAYGHEDEHPSEVLLRESAMRTAAEATIAINHGTGHGDHSSRATLRDGTISAWRAADDCPLNYDIVIPEELTRVGRAGGKYLSVFLERRGYKRGIHYHHVRDVGIAFHVSSPLGGAVDTREYAPASEFKLPTRMLAQKMTVRSEWHERRELCMNGSTVGWRVTEYVRRTVAGASTAEAGDVVSHVEECITHHRALEDWDKSRIKAKCEELYTVAGAMSPPFDPKTSRARGSGRSGGRTKADEAAELRRLSQDTQLAGALCMTRFTGSTSALQCARPAWPPALRYRECTIETGRSIVRHQREDEIAAEERRVAEEARQGVEAHAEEERLRAGADALLRAGAEQAVAQAAVAAQEEARVRAAAIAEEAAAEAASAAAAEAAASAAAAEARRRALAAAKEEAAQAAQAAAAAEAAAAAAVEAAADAAVAAAVEAAAAARRRAGVAAEATQLANKRRLQTLQRPDAQLYRPFKKRVRRY